MELETWARQYDSKHEIMEAVNVNNRQAVAIPAQLGIALYMYMAARESSDKSCKHSRQGDDRPVDVAAGNLYHITKLLKVAFYDRPRSLYKSMRTHEKTNLSIFSVKIG
ncbi:hypothetical protein OIU77_001123 [Salix suchowensis]|uniref:Uncharacterized protein n=1 Tax=Salix suchowensis TaxID=1278906 RepID=A0ABQ8ZGB4_9ROSI|nr:hypothetical protein OIU77_001123 [Salix suchowensis]